MVSPQRSGWVTRRLLGSPLLGLLVSGLVLSCGDQASCPTVPYGVKQAVNVETTFSRLNAGEGIDTLVVDDSGLYWYDAGGAILSLPKGESQPIELRPAPAQAVVQAPPEHALRIVGVISDADRLYWGEGFRYTGIDAGSVVGYQPPGRLLSMPKGGGAETVLHVFSDRTLTPLVADNTRIIVKVEGADTGYYQVSKADGRLERLPANPPFETSRVVGDKIYWTEPGLDNPQLFRTGFDAFEPELMTRIEGSGFDVGPGYILWRQERLITEPELILDQNFVMQSEASGCTQALPGLGETLSFTTALDPRHVYWYSFNGLGAVSNATPSADAASNASALPSMPLVRVDLETGVLERLSTPGFSLSLGEQIVGHDAERLYLSTGAGLVAVRKP